MGGATALLTNVGRRRPPARPLNRPPGPVVLAGFLAAVIAFVTSTVVSTLRLHDVSMQSLDLDSNVFPRVVALATLRERVRELTTKLNDAVEAEVSLPLDVATIEREIREQERAFEAHAESEARSDEWMLARSDLEEVIQDTTALRDHLKAGNRPGARALLEGAVRPLAAAADQELWRLVDQTAGAGTRSARGIGGAQSSAVLLSFALDALCVALASILAVITFRSVSRYSRLVEVRSQELEQFAVRVAHDVRSPLSPVLFALQQIGRKLAADDPGRPAVERASRSLGRVTSLVDDLLAFAQAGGDADRSARSAAVEVTRAVVDDARPQAQTLSIDLRLEAPVSEVVIACPAGVLTSLVTNLVRNALKYMAESSERRIVVRISSTDPVARFEVMDTGPGLPPGAEDRVFEPYVRADRSGQPGLGLGLATVKRLTEAYGGRVGVWSTPTGCMFWFELPLASNARLGESVAVPAPTNARS